jgi:hypothetical protein
MIAQHTAANHKHMLSINCEDNRTIAIVSSIRHRRITIAYFCYA